MVCAEDMAAGSSATGMGADHFEDRLGVGRVARPRMIGGGEAMDRRIRIMGLCLTVAFALSGVIAANAQASTEIVSSPVCVKAIKIVKGYTGHYRDKHCTEKASEEEINLGGKENKYELDPGPAWVAKGKAVKGKAVKLVSAQLEIVCKKSGGSGEVLGPTRVQATFRFLGCTLPASEHRFCTTHAREPGEIETKVLLGVIGESASKEALVSFTGTEPGSTEPAPAETFAEFECGEILFTLHGTLSGRWTEAVNKMTKKGGIDFAVGTGEQGLIERFVNQISKEPEEEAATLEATQSFKFNAEYEIKQG
jgi:hypothetical protein